MPLTSRNKQLLRGVSGIGLDSRAERSSSRHKACTLTLTFLHYYVVYYHSVWKITETRLNAIFQNLQQLSPEILSKVDLFMDYRRLMNWSRCKGQLACSYSARCLYSHELSDSRRSLDKFTARWSDNRVEAHRRAGLVQERAAKQILGFCSAHFGSHCMVGAAIR